MAEQEEEEGRKGGKGRLLAFVAVIGTIVAALTFWRRRRGHEE
jgi:hypothetical protein